MKLSSIIDHNQQLKSFYRQLTESADSASNVAEIYQTLEKVKKFGQPLKYNNVIIGGLISLLVLLGVLVSLIFGTDQLPLFIILTIIILLFINFAYHRQRAFLKLSEKIFTKKILLDNELIPQSFDIKAMTLDLLDRFNDFDRGNDAKDVQQLYAGKYQGQEHQFQYQYYKYHYVVREEEQKTDTKGNTTTETTYHHYYRYGIFLDFPYVVDLSFDKPTLLFNKGIYRPASNQFNRYYTVHGKSEIDAAKFLKPMIVKAFEDIYPQFSALHFQFNRNHELCVSFDDNVLHLNRSHSLYDIDDFLVELEQPLISTKLVVILNLIDKLMTYSDNNFEVNN